MLASIVIRTLNEARYLGELLDMIARQQTGGDLDHEVIVVDSGSTDGTLDIACNAGARITHIDKSEFSFGRSLNRGCDAARGDYLVFISGHCVPTGEHWLEALCRPLIDGRVAYTYGQQRGGAHTQFSEGRIFAKYFPAASAIPQEGFFCNNANSAMTRTAWAAHRFDEDLTGLEDMAMAKALMQTGARIGYVADAAVYHHHAESWAQIRRRFEREAIALQSIMPEVHLSRFDLVRYIVSSVRMDWGRAIRERQFSAFGPILKYRIAQFTGSYRGNNDHRKLSQARKDRFFYPSVNERDATNERERPHDGASSYEGQQPACER